MQALTFCNSDLPGAQRAESAVVCCRPGDTMTEPVTQPRDATGSALQALIENWSHGA